MYQFTNINFKTNIITLYIYKFKLKSSLTIISFNTCTINSDDVEGI